ncbi:MAG: hypothetical protein ACHQ7M_20290 [Chloroflexota bacterium]
MPARQASSRLTAAAGRVIFKQQGGTAMSDSDDFTAVNDYSHMRGTRQVGVSQPRIATIPRLLAVEVLLAEPEALQDDVLESCLYILRDRLQGSAQQDART